MPIKLEGIKGMQKAISKYPNELEREFRKTLTVFGNKMVKHARRDHRFKRKSGNLDRAISIEVPRKRVALKFFINDSLLRPKGRSKKGNSYGVFMHEGTYQGYRKSKSARGFASSSSKSGTGWKYDHFMDRAWEKYLKSMKMALQIDMMDVARKLKLK